MAKKETSKVEEKEKLPDEKNLESVEDTAEEEIIAENNTEPAEEKVEEVEETSKVEENVEAPDSLKVVEGFIDKYHRDIVYHVNDILIVKENPSKKAKECENHIEYEISAQRAEELLKTNLVERI